jgi:PAS domain S-box-containing protein
VAEELHQQIERLRPGDHLCLIYESRAEQLAIAAAFTKAGLERGERCLYIADEGSPDEIVAALAAAQIDVARERQRGALLLLTTKDTYLREPTFDARATIALYRSLVNEAVAAGYSGVRGAAEMTWALRPEIGCERLIEYEALLNYFFAEARAIGLCQYHRSRFPPAVLHGILRTHPLAVLGNQVCANLYYEPPELVVRPGGRVEHNGLAERVDWMMLQLQRAKSAEQERAQAQQALAESERRYRQLFEHGPHPMLIVDWQSKRFLEVNDATVAHYGYSRAEFGNMTIFDIRPPEDVPRLREHLNKPPPDVNISQWRHLKKDGTIIHVEVFAHWISFNGQRARFILIHDVSERLHTEEALRASEAKYRSLVENLDVQVFLKDRRGRYIAANSRFCQALGKSEDEIVGRTDFDLYPPPVAEKRQADDLQVLSDSQPLDAEEIVEFGGRPHTLRIVRTLVKDHRGAAGGVLGMCWDVTQQRALEAQLRQAQKMDAIGMLAGGIAHDFNNLLTVIVGNIALALGGLPENHPSRDLMLTAERAGVQANELTNRLLGFARQTILRPVATQLGPCIEETVRILRRTVDPRIVLESRLAPRLWLVEADPAQVNQVLLNLCLNARDAMPQGGRLLLEATNVVVDTEYARGRVEARPGEFVRLSITDTGHGIAPEIRSRIFEPFFTTKPAGKGTGLGLAMVFGIIKQHHGWVDFSSTVNRGTCFDIFLPRHGVGAAPATAPPTATAAPRGGNETILLADDEPMIRQLGRTILERYGYRILLAEDGLEAVQLYERHKNDIALVILDLMMPRLSGHDASQHLLQIDPHVRVLLASGYSAEHLDQGYHEQIVGFISKPFHPDQLVRAVRDALDKPRQPNPQRS